MLYTQISIAVVLSALEGSHQTPQLMHKAEDSLADCRTACILFKQLHYARHSSVPLWKYTEQKLHQATHKAICFYCIAVWPVNCCKNFIPSVFFTGEFLNLFWGLWNRWNKNSLWSLNKQQTSRQTLWTTEWRCLLQCYSLPLNSYRNTLKHLAYMVSV